MEEETEFIRNKKIDYVEQLFHEPKQKRKINLTREETTKVTLARKVVRSIIETPTMKARKAEIVATKSAVYRLLTSMETPLLKNNEISIQNRRAELIGCKKNISI